MYELASVRGYMGGLFGWLLRVARKGFRESPKVVLHVGWWVFIYIYSKVPSVV